MSGMLARGSSNGSQDAESIQQRHHYVGQHQGGPQASRGVQRLGAIRDRVHLISAGQQMPDVLAHNTLAISAVTPPRSVGSYTAWTRPASIREKSRSVFTT